MPLDHFLNDILKHNVMLVVLCRVVSMCPGVTPSSFPVAGYSEASLIPTPILARIIDSTYALTGIRGFATVMSYQAVFVRGGHLKTYTVKWDNSYKNSEQIYTKHFIDYPYCTELASDSCSNCVLDLQPALFRIAAYVCNTRGAKE